MKPSVSTDSPPLLFRKPETATLPDFSLEKKIEAYGYKHIAGIDEAGRGPLAGPVVCAAVHLQVRKSLPSGIDDSKKMSAANRERLFEWIIANCEVSVSCASAAEVDRINIRNATLNAMTKAAEALPAHAGWFLVDGRDVPDGLKGGASAVIKGDGRSLNIAAASIVAKVMRDRMLVRAHELFPQYGFANHKGYGTKAHMEALAKFGPCPLHRYSFAPICNL